jgi:leader peptidase (prepilin peptidase)/N-methyltransferase
MTRVLQLALCLIGIGWGLLLHRIAQWLIKSPASEPGNGASLLLTPATTRIFACIIASFCMVETVTTFQTQYQWTFLVLISALIIAIITDAQTLLISRFTSIFLVPCAWLCAAVKLLPISLLSSIIGALFGYALLALTARVFHRLTQQQGLGQGDSDLLSCIGAFTGPWGVWLSLLFGSVLGTVVSIWLLSTGQATRTTPIPFGPFLALGAIVYLFYGSSFLTFIYG